MRGEMKEVERALSMEKCVVCGKPAAALTRDLREKPRFSWESIAPFVEYEVAATYCWCKEHAPK